MTIKEILNTYPQKLKSDSPALDVELLLSKVLKKSKEELFIHSEEALSFFQMWQFKKLFNKRKNGTPIAYLTGHQEFYDLDFKVTKDTLIPRPETELLVEEALHYISNHPEIKTIIDVGVGSGAILLSLAHRISDQVSFIGTDISKNAIGITKENAQKLNLLNNITLYQGNLLSPLVRPLAMDHKPFAIVANLPYLDDKAIIEPSIQKEPKNALYGGPDGLDLYRKLFAQLQEGAFQPQALFLEMDDDQAEGMKEIVKGALPEYTVTIKQDLCGLDRLAIISK